MTTESTLLVRVHCITSLSRRSLPYQDGSVPVALYWQKKRPYHLNASQQSPAILHLAASTAPAASDPEDQSSKRSQPCLFKPPSFVKKIAKLGRLRFIALDTAAPALIAILWAALPGDFKL